ncbi:hypothetical protein BDV39DRAFT_183132 [Aspergillus sergii]|uniref:Uncharacterized protein n=1 Tax=Aspergillus sergii TaxID=1034303 RepID=A0A5N6WS69_9EURO|nr:hypothetical protein BDV39DRAFT_183132 [Aspergillus sergii]
MHASTCGGDFYADIGDAALEVAKMGSLTPSCRDCSDIHLVSRKFATCAQCRTRVGRTQRSVSTCGGFVSNCGPGEQAP